MKKKTLLNIILILFVLSFFVTPLGYEGKIALNRLFASSVELIPVSAQKKIDFDWKLKDRNDVQFNFNNRKERLFLLTFGHRGVSQVLLSYIVFKSFTMIIRIK